VSSGDILLLVVHRKIVYSDKYFQLVGRIMYVDGMCESLVFFFRLVTDNTREKVQNIAIEIGIIHSASKAHTAGTDATITNDKGSLHHGESFGRAIGRRVPLMLVMVCCG